MRRFLAFFAAALVMTPADAHAFFFLAALPAAGAAASGAAAGAAAAAAASSTFLTASQIALGVLGVAGKVFSAISAKQQADAEADRLELEAKLEGTAALQRDTQRRQELARTVGSIRAARGDSAASFSPTETSFLDEANEVISSDRMVEFLNGQTRASNLRQSARNTRSRGRTSLLTGVGGAGISLFQTGSFAARSFF